MVLRQLLAEHRKVFAHGVSTPEDEEVVLGPTFDETLSYLERRYNDGPPLFSQSAPAAADVPSCVRRRS
jgi:hypothetical protein